MIFGTPEQQRIEDLQRTYAAIESAIYHPVSALLATAWVTPEPVPFSQRRSGRRLDIAVGDRWGQLWDCAWFHFTGAMPEGEDKESCVLLIDLSGEGCVVDSAGSPVLGLTTPSSEFDRRHGEPGKRVVPISFATKGARGVELWVEAGCNDLFGGYRNSGKLREASIAVMSEPLRELYFDFGVLLDLLKALPHHGARRAQVLSALERAARALPTLCIEEAIHARQELAPELAKVGGSPSLTISALGQAHLDLAWLWPLRETIRKAGRTFSTTLALMDRYPDYVFGASQAQLYEWVNERYPDVFARVKARIAEGRWEPQGAMWVEADVNMSGGEALVRQILYGKKFFQNEFGVDGRICWLPDDFGFPASLPQILKQSGVDYFLTIKLSWSSTNRFPLHSFWWEGIDGSRVLAHMPPEDTYNSSALPRSLRKIEERYTDKDVSGHAMLLYGIGDGGGGPGEEHLERLDRETNLEGLPPVLQEPALAFFNRLETEAARFKTWVGELYLEKHQGTYTTQARNKWFNRRLEAGLRDLEWLATVCATARGEPYPRQQLEELWKEVLLYQFHDILPGSSITRVYDESLARYGALLRDVESRIEEMIERISRGVSAAELDDPAIVVNSLPWERRELVDFEGHWHQVECPSFGYALVDLAEKPAAAAGLVARAPFLENDLLRLEFAPDGTIASIVDNALGREILSRAEGNALVLFHDDGDAWDFPPDYRTRPFSRCLPESTDYLMVGPTARVRQRYRFGNSVIDQTVVLTEGSRRIDFVTHVDWRETHRMLRTSFPVAVRANEVTCDIQFGTIRRSTHLNTTWDIARDEVCAHKWVDISQHDYGIALLNDCKYGHRVKGNVLDLCLLRSPTTPDPKADQGLHQFTYSLYPHVGDHVTGRVAQAAYELNVPIRIQRCPHIPRATPPGRRRAVRNATDTRKWSFLRVHGGNVMVEAVKMAEDSSNVILRLYETAGGSCVTALQPGIDVKRAWTCDLMEHRIREIPIADNGFIHLPFSPFEIKTVRLVLPEQV